MRSSQAMAPVCVCAVSVWLASGGGCAPAVIASAGLTAGFGLAQSQAAQFINGELKAAREASMDQSIAAVRIAMSELQLNIKVERRTRHRAFIMARSPGGPEIAVTMSTISPVATKFEIRVGIFGDQAVSQFMMDAIDIQLKPWHEPKAGAG